MVKVLEGKKKEQMYRDPDRSGGREGIKKRGGAEGSRKQ